MSFASAAAMQELAAGRRSHINKSIAGKARSYAWKEAPWGQSGLVL